MAPNAESLGFGQAAWQFLTDDDDQTHDSKDGGQAQRPILLNLSAHLRGRSQVISTLQITR